MTTIRSPLYLLERSDAGVVHLDRDLKVVAMNSFARRVLPIEEKAPFEKMVLSFHPERSVAKVKFLLDQAECPVSNPPPMTMIINIPERVLLIKVTKLSDARGESAGYTLIFYDITELVSGDDTVLPVSAGASSGVAGTAALGASKAAAKRQLHKIPTVSQNRIVLVDVETVTYIRSEGHYTWVSTAQGSSFCNLNISDLAERLDGASFFRIHRSYLANLDFAEQILRDEGKVSLKLRGETTPLPVARTSVPRLLEQLGIGEVDALKS
jgi:LytTR family transcriptional regulator, CO-responsive transcriptional regulator RcoM